jgi:RimJ/RimL family protein N-acetyltransferase
MQQSWRLDHDKLTFIICRAPSSPPTTITPQVHDTPDTMIGDVNLFLYDASDAEDQSEQGSRPVLAELEIMIAPHQFRRQGFARESLLAFVAYVTANLEGILEEYRRGCDERSERYLTYLRVKIDQGNEASVKLFGGLGFEKEGGVNYFGEVEMRIGVKDGAVVGLNGGGAGKVVGYRI